MLEGVTVQHALDFKLSPQGDNESDSSFRHRVAGELRNMGHVIEAHEAQQNRRYDDPEAGTSVVDGVMGAMAQALQGVDYRVRGEQQVGCDIAAGMLVRHGKSPEARKQEADAILMMVAMMGQRR